MKEDGGYPVYSLLQRVSRARLVPCLCRALKTESLGAEPGRHTVNDLLHGMADERAGAKWYGDTKKTMNSAEVYLQRFHRENDL